MRTKIMHEDEDILIIHKPSGIATQTDRMGQADVVSELKNYLAKNGKDTYIGVIHRLDQPVEGLLVFAKNKKAAAQLSKQITDGTLKKYYFALVYGLPCQEDGEFVDELVKCPGNVSAVKETIQDTKLREQAKKARLQYHCCYTKDYQDKKYSLVEIELFTGRHHQIRVQMSYHQLPLLGDNKYGSIESQTLSQEFGIAKTALLAYRLVLKHPRTGKMVEFELKVPDNWR